LAFPRIAALSGWVFGWAQLCSTVDRRSYLYALIGLLVVAVGSLILEWAFVLRMVNGSGGVVTSRLAACALAAGGLSAQMFQLIG
jgi:hypothetical protein